MVLSNSSFNNITVVIKDITCVIKDITYVIKDITLVIKIMTFKFTINPIMIKFVYLELLVVW